MWRAKLIGANRTNSKVSDADLRETCLRNADLTEAQVEQAKLAGADLLGVKGTAAP